MDRNRHRQLVVRPTARATDRSRRALAIAAAVFLTAVAVPAAAKSGGATLGPTTGHISFDDTGNLTLDLGFGGATYANTWSSAQFPSADGPCRCGQGSVRFYGNSVALAMIGPNSTLRDIAAQLNDSKEMRAAVVDSGEGYRLVVANVSGNGGLTSFDDTGNLTIPSGVEQVVQKGVDLGGTWAPATMISSLVSSPVLSPASQLAAGDGTLSLGYGAHATTVRISRRMNLYHVAAAINASRSVFHAEVRPVRIGSVLVVHAVAPESRALYGFDDTGSLTIPGVHVGFDDTGNLTISGGWTNFDDTGNLTISGGMVDFDDTGNLTVPRDRVSFDDTGNLTRPGIVDFDDTGNLTIEIGGLTG